MWRGGRSITSALTMPGWPSGRRLCYRHQNVRYSAEISRAKDAGITPEQYLARAQATHNPRNIRIGEIYQTYWQRLFSAGAMDSTCHRS